MAVMLHELLTDGSDGVALLRGGGAGVGGGASGGVGLALDLADLLRVPPELRVQGLRQLGHHRVHPTSKREKEKKKEKKSQVNEALRPSVRVSQSCAYLFVDSVHFDPTD